MSSKIDVQLDMIGDDIVCQFKTLPGVRDIHPNSTTLISGLIPKEVKKTQNRLIVKTLDGLCSIHATSKRIDITLVESWGKYVTRYGTDLDVSNGYITSTSKAFPTIRVAYC